MKNETITERTEYLTIGILAHVDAGKTTLSEALLFKGGAIRRAGRVDNGDTLLDTDSMERARGITIYSKTAAFTRELPGAKRVITILDTPGHADFSPETERALKVLDYAVLVVSAADGVTGQVRLLWSLLSHYHIPTLIFVNKMDQPGADRALVMQALNANFGDRLKDFTYDITVPALQEDLAVLDDGLLSAYLDGTPVTDEDVKRLIRERRLFPVWFGSALRLDGIEAFMKGTDRFAVCPERPDAFGARVFKITRDENGARLTWMKLTGGTLRVKTVPGGLVPADGTDAPADEKADQIRFYSGEKYRSLQEASAGMVVAVTGLTSTYAGQGLGTEVSEAGAVLSPVLTCRLVLEDGTDPFDAYRRLSPLIEEEPLLHLMYDAEKSEITVQIMGQVQKEVLSKRILDRFGLRVSFGPTGIVYKETIADTVEGVGHFEPLRHYAEVHVMLSPGERGSGIKTVSECPSDLLSTNWQRLILTHLMEKEHKGVLTGSPLTDVTFTLVAGKAHEKHTEGGDFRQATYRAVRQGLMLAESVLLEPWYDFRMELPAASLGRALNDLSVMHADFGQPDIPGDTAVITGSVAVGSLGEYAGTLAAYTRGEGRLFCTLSGYRPCRDPEPVILEKGYDPLLDNANPTHSVFCAHGSGFAVPWDEVRDRMHVDSGWRTPEEEAKHKTPGRAGMDAENDTALRGGPSPYGSAGDDGAEEDPRSFKERQRALIAQEKELIAIFERTYGPIRRRTAEPERVRRTAAENAGLKERPRKAKPAPEKAYLLVDGYNIIHAWDELRSLAEKDMKAARDRLKDILSNFAGFRKEHVILVFDAYRVAGGPGEVSRFHNIDVVYTKEAETADLYIEKTAHELSRNYQVTVATSDAVEQVIIFTDGCFRMSAKDLLEEVIRTEETIRSEYLSRPGNSARAVSGSLREKLREAMEKDAPDGTGQTGQAEQKGQK